MRWLAPPPSSTAHLSSSRRPGAVLRVSRILEGARTADPGGRVFRLCRATRRRPLVVYRMADGGSRQRHARQCPAVKQASRCPHRVPVPATADTMALVAVAMPDIRCGAEGVSKPQRRGGAAAARQRCCCTRGLKPTGHSAGPRAPEGAMKHAPSRGPSRRRTCMKLSAMRSATRMLRADPVTTPNSSPLVTRSPSAGGASQEGAWSRQLKDFACRSRHASGRSLPAQL